MTRNSVSRRSFLTAVASAPLATSARAAKKVPVGLELYSVRDVLKDDVEGTVRGVAKMGYEGVEFYSPYYDWTPQRAKEIRKLLDDLGIKCFSTHNDPRAFTDENLPKSVELNHILGSRFIVMASAGEMKTADDWKKVAHTLSHANDAFRGGSMQAGFHNHDLEWKPIDGVMPMEILAKNTPKDVVLQLDVGTCVEMGVDPVAWINKNPGRIRSMHCKDWSPDPAKGYKVLFGDGKAPWKQIFAAAEKTGGIQSYLIEQEGADTPSMETAKLCLERFRKLHG